MRNDFKESDYKWIEELMRYPESLDANLDFFDNTSDISLPDDPIEKVIFQDKAKQAIRKIARNKGHILMVGKPGTGKSLLANMFEEVLTKSFGDYIRNRKTVIAYPGKDMNHVRFAYESPERVDDLLSTLNDNIDSARKKKKTFNLSEQIQSVKKIRNWLLLAALLSGVTGLFFPPVFILTGIAGIGSIFMFMQENNHKAQEKIQQEMNEGKLNSVKHIYDLVPEVLYDPRKDRDIMARVSEPDARNMKGGFRHDPYQSSDLKTPAHKRAYIGAHAKAPIIYVDELKTLVRAGYMPDMLEIMQNKKYILEGGKNTGSGSADKSENSLRADNIIIACCNHDTLRYLQQEGDGAFLSRIEDKGEIIQMETEVPETPSTIRQSAQYIKQEINNLDKEFKHAWEEIIEKEGYEGIRKRSEYIFGRELPEEFELNAKDFSKTAVREIIREMKCRASDGKLSSILRPINGIIKTAGFEAILNGSELVEANHVRHAIETHLSLEGEIARSATKNKKDLKKYIDSITDSIGYIVGLAVTGSESSGRMYGQPLPIHCQINAGSADIVTAPGKIGDIAKAAAQNVRASIKKVLAKIGAPYVGYEMHVEYIQAHGGIEGDSASVAMDVALISDFIKRPVSQKYGVTGSLTGDIILSVGGVTEKIRSIMDVELGMKGACIPWQNKHDVEPLLINEDFTYIQFQDVPGIRIFRREGRNVPFDIYFCKTKYHVYKILMGVSRQEVEDLMGERSKNDLLFIQNMKNSAA